MLSKNTYYYPHMAYHAAGAFKHVCNIFVIIGPPERGSYSQPSAALSIRLSPALSGLAVELLLGAERNAPVPPAARDWLSRLTVATPRCV